MISTDLIDAYLGQLRVLVIAERARRHYLRLPHADFQVLLVLPPVMSVSQVEVMSTAENRRLLRACRTCRRCGGLWKPMRKALLDEGFEECVCTEGPDLAACAADVPDPAGLEQGYDPLAGRGDETDEGDEGDEDADTGEEDDDTDSDGEDTDP